MQVLLAILAGDNVVRLERTNDRILNHYLIEENKESMDYLNIFVLAENKCIKVIK